MTFADLIIVMSVSALQAVAAATSGYRPAALLRPPAARRRGSGPPMQGWAGVAASQPPVNRLVESLFSL